MEPRKTRFAVRAAGGAIILLSVFLPWFFGQSLYGISGLIGSGQAAGPAGAVTFFYAVVALVVIGGLLSFVTRAGGVVALVGAIVFVGFLMLISPVALSLMGVGVWAAMAGSIVVLASKRIGNKLVPNIWGEGELGKTTLPHPPDDWRPE